MLMLFIDPSREWGRNPGNGGFGLPRRGGNPHLPILPE
jgi:hypothetical protein